MQEEKKVESFSREEINGFYKMFTSVFKSPKKEAQTNIVGFIKTAVIYVSTQRDAKTKKRRCQMARNVTSFSAKSITK